MTVNNALAALRQRGADEAERAHGRPRRIYLAVLDRRYAAALEQQALAAGTPLPAFPPLLDAIDAELATLAAAQKVRPRLVALLAQVPEPEHEPKIVADAMRSYRGAAMGALRVLDLNPGQLEDWKQKIAAVAPDCGSPEALAVGHFARISPLLGQARAIAAVPEELATQWQEIQALAAEAVGRPIEVAHAAGPLPPAELVPLVARPRFAKSRIGSGDDAA